MKLEFLTSEVLPKLRQVAFIVSSKNSAQILSSVCFTVKGNTMCMTACDSTQWLTVRTNVISSDSDMEFCVVASDIVKVLNSLGGMKVIMVFDEEKKMLTCEYGKGELSMPYESAVEYPRPQVAKDNATKISASGKSMRRAISLCSVATAVNDDLRPMLKGIQFCFLGDSMTGTATDTHQLFRYSCKSTTVVRDGHKESFVLPPKAATALSMVADDDDVNIYISDSNAIFVGVDFKLTTVLIEGSYPDCERLINMGGSIKGKINKNEFVQGLSRAVMMGDKLKSLVSLKFVDDEFTISAEDFSYSKSSYEKIKCSTNEHPELNIGFNGIMLTELLKTFSDEEVSFELSQPNRPLFIHGNDEDGNGKYTAMLMPKLA